MAFPAVPVLLADATRGDAAEASDPTAERAVRALAAVRGDTFGARRDEVASLVAGRLELDAIAMQQARASADTEHQLAVLTCLTQFGVPYRRNTSKPGEGWRVGCRPTCALPGFVRLFRCTKDRW